MSELKADKTFVFGEECEAYKKSEADKVIAEKDKEIQRLENLCESYRIDCDNLAITTDRMRTVGRTLREKMTHHKYKRCLAMAMRCSDACDKWMMKKATAIKLGKDGVEYYHQARRKLLFYMRWQKRWLEIAEKFKEAK